MSLRMVYSGGFFLSTEFINPNKSLIANLDTRGNLLISRVDFRKMCLTPKKKPKEERNGHFLLWILYLDVIPRMAVAPLLRIKPILRTVEWRDSKNLRFLMTLSCFQSTNSKGGPSFGLSVIVDNTFLHFSANLSQVFITVSWKTAVFMISRVLQLGLSWVNQIPSFGKY